MRTRFEGEALTVMVSAVASNILTVLLKEEEEELDDEERLGLFSTQCRYGWLFISSSYLICVLFGSTYC